jgi:hypothetical protein
MTAVLRDFGSSTRTEMMPRAGMLHALASAGLNGQIGLGNGSPRLYLGMLVRPLKPHFRGFDLNNIDYQWLAGHLAF